MTRHDPKTFPRVKIRYTGVTGTHSTTLHLPGGATSADASGVAANVAGAFKGLLPTAYSFTTADFAVAGSNVFNPIAFTPVTGTNVTTPTADRKGQVLSFTGKTVLGTRCNVYMFTDIPFLISAYRILTPLPTQLVTALTFLQSPTAGFVAIDGLVPTFHSYVNADSQEHYVKRLRRA